MFLAANFILPVSKDMPGSDEFFYQVNYSHTGHCYCTFYVCG